MSTLLSFQWLIEATEATEHERSTFSDRKFIIFIIPEIYYLKNMFEKQNSNILVGMHQAQSNTIENKYFCLVLRQSPI
jgi:hypothetical protein